MKNPIYQVTLFYDEASGYWTVVFVRGPRWNPDTYHVYNKPFKSSRAKLVKVANRALTTGWPVFLSSAGWSIFRD